MTSLFQDLHPEHEKDSRFLLKEESLQLAFLRTFPKNICVNADDSREFPYFMMLHERSLVKIHGSSIVGDKIEKPQWVCCQNLIVSSVTNRPMAKFIVPINEKMLEYQDKIDVKKIQNINKRYRPITIQKNDQPTAVLRYLRGKNHNEYIQSKLKDDEAYLETDEDKERIIYFYIEERDRKDEKQKKIHDLIAKVEKDCKENILKRNFVSPVSDKSRLHIDAFGVCVDILDSSEYISFLVKSANIDIERMVLEGCKKLGLGSLDIQIIKKKISNIMIVCLQDKIVSRALFESCRSEISYKRMVQSE